MRWVVKRGIRLESLKIGDSRRLSTSDIYGGTLFGLNVSSLQCIDLRKSGIGDEDVLSMARGCPCLAEICLSGCDGVTNASLAALGKSGRQLISMDIGECSNVTDEGLEGFADGCLNMRVVKLLDELDTTNIEEKCLLGCMNISKSDASDSVISSSLLRHVNPIRCDQITDIGISALARSCPQLSNIDLHDCKQITDIGMSALARSCSNLYSIKLSSCDQITDMGISEIAHRCSHLNDIDISFCDQVTDMGISALAHSCPTLSNINLTFSRNKTDEGISAIANSCHLLSDINISFCEQITDVGISALACRCHFLRRISLIDCVHITDMGISALANSLSYLKQYYSISLPADNRYGYISSSK